ncbi:hypothetical protein BsWGS_19462 [Bradybaena similaris]
MEKQTPGEIPTATSPLSRVHRREICDQTEATSAAKNADGEFSTETTPRPQTSSSNEDKESKVTKEKGVFQGGHLLIRLQDGFESSFHQFPNADSKKPGVDSIESSDEGDDDDDDDDIPHSEFSQARLQMKSLTQTQITSDEEADLANIHWSDINTTPTIEPHQLFVLYDYSNINRLSQARNRPFDMSKTYFEPKLKHEIQIPDVFESQNTEVCNGACSLSLSEIAIADCSKRISQVDERPAEAAPHGRPPTPMEVYPTLMPLLPVVQTAPPRELILSPATIPQLVLKQRPNLTFLPQPVSRLAKVDAQSQSSIKDSPTTSLSSDSTPQMPPPPYSECVRYMASPHFRKTVHQSPKVGRKSHEPPRNRGTVAPLATTRPEVYANEDAVYSQLYNSDTPLHGSDVSVNTRNKSDGQVPLDGMRPVFLDNEHQFLAFISCLFCWPIGLVAIYYSNMCQIFKAEGNYVQADIYSRQAFIVSTLAMCAGSLTYIVMLIYNKIW